MLRNQWRQISVTKATKSTLRRYSATVLGKTVGNFIAPTVTEIWHHLTYDSREAWHTLYHFSYDSRKAWHTLYHLTYDSREGWHTLISLMIQGKHGIHCMPCFPRTVSEMLPIIHKMERCDFFSYLLFILWFYSLFSLAWLLQDMPWN